MDLDLAREILAFPTPYGHLCTTRDKLDVIIRYASTVGEDLSPHERLVLNGIMAVRADIIHFGG